MASYRQQTEDAATGRAGADRMRAGLPAVPATTFDANKLTSAAAWSPENWDGLTFQWLRSPEGRHDLAFLKLARQALDIQIRRGWWAVPCGGGWRVRAPDRDWPFEEQRHADPLTAIVAAEAWYIANVEAK